MLGSLLSLSQRARDRQPHGGEDNLMKTPECGAKARSTGLPCRKAAEPGRSRCRLHGGATPRGIASPHFIDGRYSLEFPPRLRSRYVEACNDPELLSLRDDVAVIETFIREKFAQIR